MAGILISLAMRNLQRHWVRSLLAGIGIMIGVFAIASLGLLGNSLVILFSGMITDVGDTLVITPHLAAASGDPFDPRSAVGAGIAERDLARITKAAGPNQVIPVVEAGERLEVRDRGGYAILLALKSEHLPLLLSVREGVFPRETGVGVLVGALLAEEYDIAPGHIINVGGEPARVVGVLEERGMAIDINPDYAVVVTHGWFADRHPDPGYTRVLVKVGDIGSMAAVKEDIDFQVNRQRERFDILDSREILDLFYSTYDAITLFLLGIGGVALLVSGVSILNVMIISVTERTKEIGILRSIGTLRGQVMRMFLYEALVIGSIGSILGGVLSIAGGYYLSVVVADTLTSSFSTVPDVRVFDLQGIGYIVLGVFFGILVSCLSGLYPAVRAVRIRPIEALRYE
ncbi:MAG: macrolide transporter ATP-binding /permease protein [Methanoregulaceae archaeon PtaU1.Bin059]|jgi:putative ABC transport system permease protein|nr:MAG: macrolide transporter ATP-binding /permease protein [Methanoregulaceae archaeon PtaB.Bin009]OPY41054.1 MAG: macrolide transporter ATP-binding /permease protein [Methanoregulaceae archaeon PtaU1.Bin059]HNQ29091.1 ABC transporter permease [Methanolinea sp.]